MDHGKLFLAARHAKRAMALPAKVSLGRSLHRLHTLLDALREGYVVQLALGPGDRIEMIEHRSFEGVTFQLDNPVTKRLDDRAPRVVRLFLQQGSHEMDQQRFEAVFAGPQAEETFGAAQGVRKHIELAHLQQDQKVQHATEAGRIALVVRAHIVQ